MSIGGYNVGEVIINWFPMILLTGVWLYFIGRMRKGPYSKYQRDCMDLTRRQVESLERIAAALEKKI